MRNAVLWDVTPCGSCKNRCFGGTYHLHLQGERFVSPFLRCVLGGLRIFHPEDGGDMFLRNVGSYKEQHGVFIPQKTAFFIVTAVKTSHLIPIHCLLCATTWQEFLLWAQSISTALGTVRHYNVVALYLQWTSLTQWIDVARTRKSPTNKAMGKQRAKRIVLLGALETFQIWRMFDNTLLQTTRPRKARSDAISFDFYCDYDGHIL
jgi:hypothetical protein